MIDVVRNAQPSVAKRPATTFSHAFLPLGLVASSIGVLAIGMMLVEPRGKPASGQIASQVASLDSPRVQNASASEEAAAAAMVALALGKVAPARSEAEIAEAERRATAPEKPQQPARERARSLAAAPVTTGSISAASVAKPEGPRREKVALAAPAPVANQVAANQAAEPQVAQSAPPRDESLLARVGSYVPSPRKIAGAMGDGVSKLTDLLPRF